MDLREAPVEVSPGALAKNLYWATRSRGAQFVFVAAVFAPLLASGIVAVVSKQFGVICASVVVSAAGIYVLAVTKRTGLGRGAPSEGRTQNDG